MLLVFNESIVPQYNIILNTLIRIYFSINKNGGAGPAACRGVEFRGGKGL